MRKGFTLVELLIVIVVIGVLSAMMMLSSTEAVSTAKASNIISNLTNLKKAVVAWYVNNLNKVIKDDNDYKILDNNNKLFLGQFAQKNKGKKEFLKYISNNSLVTLTKDKDAQVGDYFLAGEGKEWYVAYNIGSDMRLREKIAAKSNSLGLKGAIKLDIKSADKKELGTFDITYDKVYMLILKFE